MKPQTLEFERPIVELEEKLADLKRHSREHDINFDGEVQRMEQKIEKTKREIYQNLTAWERVQIARHPSRPYTLDYLSLAFRGFMELHGDRLFADDRAMPGGFAEIGGRKCVVIGHQKGRDLKENIRRNFGCANPEGYRKALRLMKLAEKFSLPFRGDRREPARDDGAPHSRRGRGDRRRRLWRSARHRRG
jgi:acetyl-CoA carboxylase carboxyl transferase subunit alpha